MSVLSSNLEAARPLASGSFKTMIILAALGAVTALAIEGRQWLTQYPSSILSAEPAQAQQTGSDIQAEIITITPTGFEPAEITRSAGRVILMVENRTDLEEVTFRLDQDGGAHLREVQLPRERPDWSEVIDLQPGTYLLTEVAHPDWLCRITVTAVE